MDYTSLPRELIYKERKSLDDFGVYDQPTLNNFIFERLFEKYAKLADFEGFALKLFNHAYYICTMAWAEKRPELRFGAFLMESSYNYLSVYCKYNVIAIVLLHFWARRWDMHGHRLARLFRLLEDELRINSEKDVFEGFYYRITQDMQAAGVIKKEDENDFVPREVNMRVLRDCYWDWCQALGADEQEVWDFVSGLGKNEKEQKLISEFLRDEMHPAFDSGAELQYFFDYIDDKIHKLYHGAEEQAKADAEFEAVLEEQALEEIEAQYNKDRVKELEDQNAKLLSRIGQLEEGIKGNSSGATDEDSEIVLNTTSDDKQVSQLEARIKELEEENSGLKEQIAQQPLMKDDDVAVKEYELRIDELRKELEALREENRIVGERHTEQKWIGCFDQFLHQNLNAEAIAHELHNITSPHLPKNERGFWWVVFTVFSEIHWLPKPSNSQKPILQWANLHFDCGWDWRKDNQFKFADINEKIRKTGSEKWNKATTGNIIGEYYGELAKSIRNAFVEDIGGKFFDRAKFILPRCQRINNGRK